MVEPVSDFRSNLAENIVNAGLLIGKGDRQKVFKEIYRRARRFKTATEIAHNAKLDRVRVLQETAKLAANHLCEKGYVDGEIAYRKLMDISHHKARVLAVANKPSLAKKIPTKQRPHVQGGGGASYTIRVRSGAQPREITVDDIQSFKLVRKFRFPAAGIKLNKMREEKVKEAFKKIIGETFDFKDWGGERNDLFTNKFRVGSTRVSAAFALKGRATKGPLVPKKMGKKGDQIMRLFLSSASVFLVVYHSKIDESVVDQLRACAAQAGLAGRSVRYGTIDGADLNRLYQAYRPYFK